MLTINKLLPQGAGLAAVLVKRAATVELDWDIRQKSRFETTDSQGRTLGIFLPRGTLVRGGDVLVAEDGSMIRVIAADQPILEVRICPEHGTPFDLLRAAYHLGNRHVPLELQPDYLRLEPDHVLADMLRAQDLIVTEKNAPFEPESGAYTAHPNQPKHTEHSQHTHHAHHHHQHQHGESCSHQQHDHHHAGCSHPHHDHSAHKTEP